MSITAAAIVAEARTWLGTPFAHQGRVRGVGVDCGGLVLGVARNLGLAVAEPGAYGMSPDPAIIERMLTRHCIALRRTELAPGDVLWFSFAGEPRHVGLASGIGVIHAWAKPGRVVEHRLDEVWLHRLRGVYRLMELG